MKTYGFNLSFVIYLVFVSHKAVSKQKMSKESEEKEGPGKPSEQILNLYKPKHVKNPVYWQCIYYIAQTNEKKDWKASDKVGFYCTKCKSTISIYN